jgi:GT2 family glycosyltransferase
MTAPLTSIVILTRNQLDCTRACVESIQAHTPEPYELIFVDNGSSDGTPAYLRSIAGATVIDNDRNLGFGGGCNQGISFASGERVLLLNNDVVVTPGWLGALHAALDESADVGIAGPRSNRVSGPQQADHVEYDVETLDGLDAWSEQWCRAHAGQRTDSARLVGFCMLVERAVLDRIGGFDLRYGLGNFEDDDLCLRAGVAGWRCRIAHDSWIHHHGSRTFTGEGIDYAATMAANFERFATAWRLSSAQIDQAAGTYRPEQVIASTRFDPARHHAPLVAVPEDGSRVRLAERRGTLLAVAAERLDPIATRESFDAVLTAFGPADDVTVAIRIDPRDPMAYALLDAAADAVGDANLPDIAILETRDEQDLAVLQAADVVLAHGPQAHARALVARHLGRDVVSVAGLDMLARRDAA